MSSSSLEMGPIGCLQTSISNYQPRLRNVTEERGSDTDCLLIAAFTEFRPRRGGGGREWRENRGIK